MGFGKQLVARLSRWAQGLDLDEAALVVRAPATVADDVLDRLTDALAASLEKRALDLGIYRRWSHLVERHDRPHIVVLLAGRPVAVVGPGAADGHSPSWLDAITAAVDRAVLRHLSVLADARAQLQLRKVAAPTPAQVEAVTLLLDCGVSCEYVDADLLQELEPSAAGSAAELAELLFDRLAPREIVVNVAPSALRRAAGDPAPDDVVRMREALYADTGIQLPDIRLQPRGEPTALSVQLNDVTFRCRLGMSAGWSDAVRAVDTTVRAAAHWYVRISDVRDTLAPAPAENPRPGIADAMPSLVGLVNGAYSEARVTACLREILRQGDSVRNLPRILWLLVQIPEKASAGTIAIAEPILLSGPHSTRGVHDSPAALAVAIRRIDGDESSFGTHPESEGTAVAVPEDVEASLCAACDPVALAAAERDLLEVALRAESARRVEISSGEAVPRVRSVLQALPHPPRVVAVEEYPL